MKDIGLPQTLHDFLSARERAIEALEGVIAQAEAADAAMRRCGLPGGLGHPLGRIDREEQRRHIDRQFWSQAFDVTGFRRLMDRQAREQFHRDLAGDTPAFTEGNIRATFGELFQQRDELWARGVVNLFRRLSGTKKSNDAFRVGRRMVMHAMVRERLWGGGLEVAIGGRFGGADQEIDDLDRVLASLEGREHQPRALEAALNQAFQDSPWEYEDDRMKVRAFKNGNLHVYLREDLVDAVNRVIANYYEGTAVARRREAV